MNLQNINILVVDDDKTFGESVKSALTRAGFRAYLVSTPADAISYVKLQDVHGVVIDCMLPKMNGIELLKKLKDQLSADPTICFMSGIFKDRQFIKTSMQKSGAHEFLTKPFDIQKVVDLFKSKHDGGAASLENLSPLAQLYLDREQSSRKLVRTLNNCEGLHNFDLPWVFQLLMGSKMSGHLNIACTNGDIAGVSFLNGNLVQVNITNEESLLGILLVDKGYLDREDLDIALSEKEDTTMLGEALIQRNFVSPHAIDTVLKSQLIWRLKRLVADSQMEINFVTSDQVRPLAEINIREIHNFFAETVENKISNDWIKAHYLPLSKNIVGLRQEKESQMNSVRYLPFIARIYPNIEVLLNKGTNLEELIAQNQEHEVVILKAIHYLNILGCLSFTATQKNSNSKHQLSRLKNLNLELEEKNFFERLGISRSAKDSDIKKAYFDLAKVLHPDKLNEDTEPEVVELSKMVFEQVQTAYNTLKKQDLKEQYLRELEVGKTEQLLKADQNVQKAKNFLLKGQHGKASPILQEALGLNSDSSEAQILMVWCDLKRTKKISDSFLTDIDRRLQLIPLASRDIASYYHTKGLYFKAQGDRHKAIKYFKTSLSRDSTYINSRRELASIESVKEKASIFQTDLKDVMGMFFKKK